MSNSLKILKKKRFLPLFITQFFGAFNDNAFKNAFLIWFTYDMAESSAFSAPMMVTIAAGLFILPFFIFSATAGQIVDKYEKSFLTRKVKQLEIILMISCFICFYIGSIYGLLIVLFFMGVQSTLFGPIKYSLLPEHLKEEELIIGNGFIEGGTFLSILLGTIFGGLIIRTEYGIEILSIALISFAITGWIASRQIPIAKSGDPDLKIGFNIFKETLKIIGYAKQERTVWLSIIGISWFWLIGATFLTQFPTYTLKVIGGNEHIVTLFLTIFSVGIGIGSIWCNKLLKGEINGRLVPAGSIGMTLSIAIFALASYYYAVPSNDLIGINEFIFYDYKSIIIILSLLSLSIMSGIYIVPLYSIMQHRSDEKYIARIIAANNVMNAMFMVMASAATILLFAAGLSVVDVLAATGVANIIVFFIVKKIVKERLENA